MPAKVYSDEERMQALALLQVNQGKVAKTAREAGISASTLIEWRDLALAADGHSQRKEGHAEAWGEASGLAAAIVMQNLERYSDMELSPRDLQSVAIVGGISSDKHLDYRDGRKGTQINVDARSLTLPPGLTADELRALAFTPPPALEAGESATT